MTAQVRASLFVPRPVAEVFAFAADLRNRGRFLPDNHRNFQVLTANVRGAGARASYELAVAGRVSRLELRVADYEESRRLVERSGVEEPTFTTTWEFVPSESGATVTMTLEYQPIPGILGSLVDRLLVRRRLRRNYAEQLRRLKEALAGPALT